MLTIVEHFFTKAKAIAFLRDYRRKYPGSVFGTNIRLGFDRLQQQWRVTGHRFNPQNNQRLIAA